ncbi:hypothetical protein EVG20_g4992 [Dentipellis fragilis]|uniref:Protein transport protein BOS1 n=1 Tax=Dentipellis fragilis TaxID=205917 RepID=A0A4Y9YU47_9AGAM|nr:hypothetical protein EVG20_g4992 [Dentipellis fragilis]
MNSLYTLGVRQTNSIQADLERLRNGEANASILGQVSASLTGLSRTIDDYDSMARREMIKAKQEKASTRLQKFRNDYAELKKELERMTHEHSDAQRAELLSGANSARARGLRHPATLPPPGSTLNPPDDLSESPFRTPTPSYMGATREQHALHEHTFIQNTEARLDDFLAQGREVLDNLVDQRNMLKGTQRRLLDAANTLGLSRDVIGWIERRSTQDMYIFLAGAVFTFVCFYFIWKYFG